MGYWLSYNPRVRVESRRCSQFFQGIAQSGRARARGARGRGIEARFPDHFGRVVKL